MVVDALLIICIVNNVQRTYTTKAFYCKVMLMFVSLTQEVN